MNRPWERLRLERRTSPPRLSDELFGAWMSDRPIFVGSRMDAEMSPARGAVREDLEQMHARPVMWETFTPQDRGPEDAYLEGVDRSDIALQLAERSSVLPRKTNRMTKLT